MNDIQSKKKILCEKENGNIIVYAVIRYPTADAESEYFNQYYGKLAEMASYYVSDILAPEIRQHMKTEDVRKSKGGYRKYLFNMDFEVTKYKKRVIVDCKMVVQCGGDTVYQKNNIAMWDSNNGLIVRTGRSVHMQNTEKTHYNHKKHL